MNRDDEKPTIYTIGHSNHSIDAFIELLRGADVDAVADVRSVPYSKRYPQFQKAPLAQHLKAAGIAYVFLGKELGARPDNPECYVDGRASYERIAALPAFAEGLSRLEDGAQRHRVALMCAEREPLHCHRTLLVSRHLIRRGNPIVHLLADGRREAGGDAEARMASEMGLAEEDMFLTGEQRIEEAYRLITKSM